MSPKTTEKMNQVSPTFVVIAVVSIIAAIAIMYWPQDSPPFEPSNYLGVQRFQKLRQSSQATPELTPFVPTVTSNTRDPFLPSSLVIAARKKKSSNNDNDQEISSNLLWSEPTDSLAKIDNKVDSKTDNKTITAKSEIKPVWKGFISSASNQVALVSYQNRTHLLKVNDILPGTEYRLIGTTKDSITFNSPAGELKLGKKEGAE